MSAHDGHREPQRLVPRRVVVRSLLRSAALSVSLILAYYLLPLRPGTGAALTWLVGGLTLVVVVIASQVRAILTAKYPWLRTITVLAVGTPLLIVAFAATYFLMASSDPASFSQPLDRTAALYFTVTVLATVGFGDIAPVTTSRGRRQRCRWCSTSPSSGWRRRCSSAPPIVACGIGRPAIARTTRAAVRAEAAVTRA